MNICVYCGSSPGNDPTVIEAAEEFGKSLAKNGHQLVYGGSSLGVMGALANSVMQNGGNVTGVIPHGLFKREVAHEGITKLIKVQDMHQRKSTMARLSDAFVALPGGFGTLEELFEIITWNQIGIMKKPVTIYNHDGFYNHLIAMIDHGFEAGFIRPENRSIINIANTLDEVLNYCKL